MTNVLPAALRPWRTWLDWFDPELAVQVGDWLQRLHPLLGPCHAQRQTGELGTEGLDDLRRRGSYERLLASEWLLAEELPDEFVRRAASGEHLFLAPRPRARHTQRSIIAVFDAGPLQLGAPRLAHLAIWILLARRALQAHAELRWGVLQAAPQLAEARTDADLKALLAQRSFATASGEYLAPWQEALPALLREGGESWLIGPDAAAGVLATGSFTHRVTLRTEPRARALEASLLERGRERKVRLHLPPSAAGVRLLHGQFTVEPQVPAPVEAVAITAVGRSPIIAVGGTHVAVALHAEPGALAFRVPPKGERCAEPRTFRWGKGYAALAATLFGRQLGVMVTNGRTLRYWPTSLSTSPCPSREQLAVLTGAAAWLPSAWLRAGSRQRVYVIDQAHRLVCWEQKNDDASAGTPYVEREGVLALAQLDPARFVYACLDGQMVVAIEAGVFGTLSMNPQGYAVTYPLGFATQGSAALGEGLIAVGTTILFGSGRTYAHFLRGFWHIGFWERGSHSNEVRVPEAACAVGVMLDERAGIGVLALHRNSLWLHFAKDSELLYTAPSHVVSCTVCPNTAVIALLTVEEQLIVFAAATRELRMFVQLPEHSSVRR